MAAQSDRLPLPFSLFPSFSSFTDSKLQPIHSADCSLRPRKNIIKLKEEWWGPTIAHSVQNSTLLNEESTGRGQSRKRRPSTGEGTDRHDATSWNRRGKVSMVAKAKSVERPSGVVERLSTSQDSQKERSTLVTSQSSLLTSPLSYSEMLSTECDASRVRPSESIRKENPAQSSPSPPLPSSFPPLRRPTSILNSSLGGILRDLELTDYQPILSDELLDPLHSVAFYRLQIEFCTNIAAPAKWSTRAKSSVFDRPFFPVPTDRVIVHGPNFSYIRKHYPLGLSPLTLPNNQRRDWIWDEIGQILDWIYGRRTGLAEIIWFIEHVPQPLLALVRIHAVTLRYRRGVSAALEDFNAYLEEAPAHYLSKEEERARELLSWLQKNLDDGRWRNWWRDEVSRERDGKIAKGNYWLNEIEGLRTIRDLERWEDDMKAANRWRRNGDC